MSAATATANAPAPKGGKKKLIIILAAVLLLVLVGGAAALLLLKKKPHADDEDGASSAEHKTEVVKRDPKSPPAYVALDMFVVNLADRDSERYAQIGITLEMVDAKEAEGMKVFMPAIRNNILMVLAHKTAADLLEKEGKERLTGEVQRAAARALGIDVPEPVDAKAAKGASKKAKADSEADDEEEPPKKKRKKASHAALPILAVHFSNFIVQ